PDYETIQRFWIVGAIRPAAPTPDILSDRLEHFEGPRKSRAATNHPITKSALVHLGEIWPQPATFDELYASARDAIGTALDESDRATLAQSLLGCFSAGLLELQAHQPRFATTPGERPTASAVAREQARSGEFVASLSHANTRLEDKVAKILLGLLDGTRDRVTLLRDFRSEASAAGFDAERITEQVLQSALERLAKSALLLA